MAPDLYSWFGLRETATFDEIKKAWRTKAREFHPDRNPENERAADAFKALNSAYQILSDPEKRARYDALRRPKPVVFYWWPQMSWSGSNTTFTFTPFIRS